MGFLEFDDTDSDLDVSQLKFLICLQLQALSVLSDFKIVFDFPTHPVSDSLFHAVPAPCARA